MELGGIEPPSAKESPHLLRPFPRHRCCGHRVAGSAACYESKHDHIVFPKRQGSLPPVNGLSHCPPLLLLPGCSDQTPRDLTARSFPLYYLIIRRQERSQPYWRFYKALFNESEQLGSHVRLLVSTSKPVSPGFRRDEDLTNSFHDGGSDVSSVK